MKHIILIVVGVVLGFSAGWYFGYTRPVQSHQRELLQDYQVAKTMLHMTDRQMADYSTQLPDLLDSMKRNDRDVAMVGLRGIEILNRGMA